MNNREFEEWVSAAFNAPTDEVDTAQITGQVLRLARRKTRLRRAWLAFAALIGMFAAVRIIGMFRSLGALRAQSESALLDFAHSLRAGQPEPMLILCVVLIALAGARAIREY